MLSQRNLSFNALAHHTLSMSFWIIPIGNTRRLREVGMLSRSLRRVLSDSRWPMPPTFLLPWAANLTTAADASQPQAMPPSISSANKSPPTLSNETPSPTSSAIDDIGSQQAALPTPGSGTPALSSSVRELLPLLKAQGSHYITAHIHGHPYLVTQGDTIKLPFFMHGVEPGDILRLNRAVNIGSRDFTLKAAAAGPKLKSPTMGTVSTLDPTTGDLASSSRVMAEVSANTPTTSESGAVQYTPHFIPHIAKGKHSYLDERLFVCRAVVMGVETEPLRIKEKTKRRQRHVKKVKSKHRFTILRVKELRIKDVEEIERLDDAETSD